MKWHLLRNRRLLGPYSEQELVKALEEKRVTLQDYVISEEAAHKGQASYFRLSDVISHHQSEEKEEEPSVDNRENSGFGDDNTESGLDEISRIFTESVSASDLVVKKTSPSTELPLQTQNRDLGTEGEDSFLSRMKLSRDMLRYFSARNIAIGIVGAGSILAWLSLGSNKSSPVPKTSTNQKPGPVQVSAAPSSAPINVPTNLNIPKPTNPLAMPVRAPAVAPDPPPPAEAPAPENRTVENEAPIHDSDVGYVAPEPLEGPKVRKKKKKGPVVEGPSPASEDEEFVEREDWEEQSEEPVEEEDI